MEKELKISELASFWGVSVPTTWNRIRKEGLTTIKKIDESKKEVAFVTVSEEILNKYIVNVNNNVNNPNNNGYYEDMLNAKNVVNNDNDVIDVEYTRETERFLPEIVATLTNVYNVQNQQIINLNNDYNERLETVYNSLKNVYDELASHKGNTKALEDKAEREGMYLNEINELKQDKETLNKDYNDLKLKLNNINNEKENALENNKILSEKLNQEEKEKKNLKTILIVYSGVLVVMVVILSVLITMFITHNNNVNNLNKPVINQINTTPEVITQPADTKKEVKPVKAQPRRK